MCLTRSLSNQSGGDGKDSYLVRIQLKVIRRVVMQMLSIIYRILELATTSSHGVVLIIGLGCFSLL